MLLEVKDLSVTFRANSYRRSGAASPQALADVSFSVERGTKFGIVGESGSGKSTLARIIVGLLRPTSGEVWLDGAKIRSPEMKPRVIPRRIQMVFQDPFGSLDSSQKIIDSLIEPLRANGLAKRKEDAEAGVMTLLQEMGIRKELLQRYPHELSGGQRQRVSIARAVLLRPELLILDEPTSSLDVSVQAQILQIIRRLQAELDLTYVLISHDLELVWYMCDKIMVMRQGRIVEIDTRENIYKNATAEYTRELIDSITKTF
jgi:peptide/nickel transport system ATP-binding protein